MALVMILHFKTKTTNKRSASHAPSLQALPDPPGLGGKGRDLDPELLQHSLAPGRELGVPWVTPQRTNGTG